MEFETAYDGPTSHETISLEYGRYTITLSPNFNCKVALRTKPLTIRARLKRIFSIAQRIDQAIAEKNTIPSRRVKTEADLFKDQINGHKPTSIRLLVNERQGYLAAMGYDNLRKPYHSRMPLPD